MTDAPRVPEVLSDLHIHVGGAVAPHVLYSIAHQQGLKLPVKTYWEFVERITSSPEKVHNLGSDTLKVALTKALDRLPKVEGHGGEGLIGRDLTNLLNIADKEAQKSGDQFIASEMFLLALANDKGEAGRLLKENGLQRKALEEVTS